MTSQVKVNLGIAAVSVLSFTAWEYRRIFVILTSTDSSDVYDKAWGFQLIIAGLFHFPIFLLLLGCILYVTTLIVKK